ncbi:surfeit locus protein 4 homolog isoform X2 [Limulus polyphemus]|uniref:Surfeit locus protein 4 homolog isoform X2 n=1 Tax=Limulus polyphemus TaxID=6850 RepID=A0ABM1SD84_LIMPO|nr:surfeit locus protein 4 homolog isoform X2 [Limulus polyphemus]
MNQNKLLSKAEDVADEVLRYGKHIMPHLARLCLVSTFIEDGIRMWLQWSDQQEFIRTSWNCGWFLASIFVLFNLVVQLGGSAMVLIRQKVEVACGLLFSIVVLQTFAYNLVWNVQFLPRCLSLIGALLLLLAESRVEGKRLFAGVPSLGDNKPRNYLQLTGRVLLGWCFETQLKEKRSC